MNILVYGAGAVGLGLASFLLNNNESVYLIGREPTVQSLKKYGLTRTGIFGNFSQPPKSIQAYPSLKDIPQKQFNFILVCVKSFDSDSAALDLSRFSGLFYKETKIILCQNGWGNAEIFMNYFTKKYIYNARIITGFNRCNPHEIEVTVHADHVRIGSLFQEPNEKIFSLCEAISRGGLPCAVSENIQKDLWAKMLYNCALNPLSAIYKVPYGVLAQHERFRCIMDNIIREIFVVMRADGLETHWPNPKSYLKAFYNEMIPNTASHFSSTLQDISAKKRTEIDALNGIIVKIARRHHIPVSFNRNIYQEIKAIESKEKKFE